MSLAKLKISIPCINCLSRENLFESCSKLRNVRLISMNHQQFGQQRSQRTCFRLYHNKLSPSKPMIKLWKNASQCVPVNKLSFEKNYLPPESGILVRKSTHIIDYLRNKRVFSTDTKKRENIFTVPNMLCLVRISLAPAISYLLLNSENLTALILLGVAGITDLLDGFIARKFKHQSSVFGSMLDPAADKILMTIATISLAWVNLLPVSLCALIVGRDIGIMSAVAYLRYTTVPKPLTLPKFFDVNLPTVQMKPTFISKVNTALQLGLVGLCMSAPVFGFTESSWLHAYLYFVGATTVLSGLSYVVKGSQTFRVLK
ncbi:cardiolipin synthase (CMP-forming)-like [Rhopilema esculentum]|uniref:cardiolipin synthase (CMP-forming)-like n=1 Tax=Rhopilema esculentum TaxID=499914 RepID=UPI0031DE7515